MLLLADCILSLDGERIALSLPPPPLDVRAPAGRNLHFGIAAVDTARLVGREGQVGVLTTRSGILLMRLRILGVDAQLNVIRGVPVPPQTASSPHPATGTDSRA